MKFILSAGVAAVLPLVAPLVGTTMSRADESTSETTETTLKTSRGTEMPVILHTPSGHTPKATLIVAPGSSCNSRGLLLETFAQRAVADGYAVIRPEWSYCSQPESRRRPHPDLEDEEQDFETALEFARTHAATAGTEFVLIGKSLGTFVVHNVFHREIGVPRAALLTPVCSYEFDENDKPLPDPAPVGEENYPTLKSETRPVLLAAGDQDLNCRIPILEAFLKDKPANIEKLVVKGGHSWEVGDKAESEKNVRISVDQVLNWLNRFAVDSQK